MTAEEAGRRWGYGPNQIKRLKTMCLSMPKRFPLVAGHVAISDDSPKIFVPDGRSRNARGYFYRYILDAIGTDSLLYPESIGITADDMRAHLNALLNNNEIERKDPEAVSWETIDFMIPRGGNWDKKSSTEKRSYLSELLDKVAGLAKKSKE